MSIAENTGNFFGTPGSIAEKWHDWSKDCGNAGQRRIMYGASSALLHLSQSIASAVALPFCLIAGIVFCARECLRGEWRQGGMELLDGVLTGVIHVAVLMPLSLLSTVTGLLSVIKDLPHNLRHFRSSDPGLAHQKT